MAEQLQNTPSIGEIVLDPNEKFADIDGLDKFDLLLCDGSEVDESKYPLYAGTGVGFRPTMNSGSDACPYRVVADEYTPSIGEVRPSNQEKYKEDGIAMFDNLLCDGSAVDKSTHPKLWDALAMVEDLPVLSNGSDLTVLSSSMSTRTASPLPTFKFEDPEGMSNYDIRYGNTQAVYPSPFLNGISGDYQAGLAETEIPVSWMRSKMRVMVGKPDSDHTDISAYYRWKYAGAVVFSVYINSLSSTSAIVRYSLDGSTYNTLSLTTQGSYTQYSGVDLLIVDGDLTVLDSVSQNTLFSVTGLDLTGADSLTVELVTTAHSGSADTVLVSLEAGIYSAYKPTNTSAYPDFPDRVIADLTEGHNE